MQKGISLKDEFVKIYKQINEECWDLYRQNLLSKEDLRSIRFQKTLEYFGIFEPVLAERLGLDYIENSPKRTKLIPHALEVLEYLNPKYHLHIITNGFEEVQHIKLRESGITPFFGEIITSEMAGAKKPDKKIFDLALSYANATPHESLYIGDDLIVDVEGGLNAGWNVAYYNPHKVKHSHQLFADVRCLSELMQVL